MSYSVSLEGLRSPWFNTRVQLPWAPGLYQVLIPEHTDVYYSVWDGKRWGVRTPWPADAVARANKPAMGVVDYWRGLAAKPGDPS